MIATAVPRPDQIDALTSGLVMPLPAIGRPHLQIIAGTLAQAWSQLLLSHRAVLVSGTEAEVTALMATRLNMLLDADPVWALLVRSITRGTETLSFNGGSLEKRPDLSIHLTQRNPSFALVIECKLIDGSNGKGHDLYCSHGLRRFLVGEYAWAVREAFMLAYVRDGTTITSVLTPFLTRCIARKPPAYSVQQLPVQIPGVALDAATSAHGRSFRYINRSPPADDPGDIDVWHLWLTT